MKTVADFKRQMTVGSLWHTTHEWLDEAGNPRAAGMGALPNAKTDLGNGICEIAQSNRFAIRRPGNARPSWCDFPKASEASFSDDGRTVTITKPGFCRLTYTLAA